MDRTTDMAYDVVIVGAGPSGLSAARTAARLGYSTLVVERLSGPGELNHPCNALILPSPGLVPSEPALGGLFFPQVDLLIPASLIITQRAGERCLAPSGEEFLNGNLPDGSCTALVDKAGLLRMLTDQARAAGAGFLWGTAATGLIFEGERVRGVRTTAGDIAAGVVIAAEGASRHLCEDTHLYATDAHSRRFLLVLAQDLDAPAVGPSHLGRVVTLGRLHSAAPAGFGTLLMNAPGRATMMYTLQIDDPTCSSASSGWQYLAEYAHDARISKLLEGACVVHRTSFLMPLSEAPESVVRDGFLAVGDAVSPGGYLGILPAIFLGRQAALEAAGALDDGDVSAARLAGYEEFYRALVLPGLLAETQATEAVLSLSNHELDALCGALNRLHVPIPLFQGSTVPPAETVSWLGQQLEIDPHAVELVHRVLGHEGTWPGRTDEAVGSWLPLMDESRYSLA